MADRWSSRSVALVVGLAASVLFLRASTQGSACTAVFMAGPGKVLVGNNEDATTPLTKVWVVPGEGGMYSRLYVGYDDLAPQGGINEKGLWFDGFSVPPKTVPLAPGLETYGGNMHDKLMAECATVEEALTLLGRYSRSFLADHMLLVGDRTGASAIVDDGAVLRRQGAYQIITNFRQSEHPDGRTVCERYRIADTMLSADAEVTVDHMRRILAAVHQEVPVPTVYSYICDLQNGTLYLYHFHNYENAVILDVKQALAKGKHAYNLPELFPTTFAAEDFASHSAAALEARKASRRYAQFDPKTYPEFAGRYVVSSPTSMAGVTVVVTAEKDRLRAELGDGIARELIPESAIAFSVWEPDNKGVSISFLRDDAGRVTGFVVDIGQERVSATRAE